MFRLLRIGLLAVFVLLIAINALRYIGRQSPVKPYYQPLLSSGHLYLSTDRDSAQGVYPFHQRGQVLDLHLDEKLGWLAEGVNGEKAGVKETLKDQKAQLFLIRLLSPQDQKLSQLADELQKYLPTDNFLIYSPFPLVIQNLKKIKPLWPYSIDDVNLARGRFLAGMFLESLAPISGDFALLNWPLSSLDARLLKEFLRRGIKVIAQISDPAQIKPSMAEQFCGVMVDRHGL